MSERHTGSAERSREAVETSAAERSAELLKKHEGNEHYSESEAKQSAEKARADANAEALFSKEVSTEKKYANLDSDAQQKPVTKKDKEQVYKQTLSHIQSEMSPVERRFSKVIHSPVVENVSDVVGSTIARPTSILYGSCFAFLGVLGLYLYARHVGFALTGFETIATFAGGWLFGLLIDFLRSLAGKR